MSVGLPDDVGDALAVGWATVELDRAAHELAHLLRAGTGFSDAPRSDALGARCQVGLAAGASRLAIILLEPDTEGPLAGTLARFGEGWAATWARSRAPAEAATADLTTTGARIVARPGPIGPERLLPGEGAAGDHRLAVDAVPSPP